jgi:methylated-DNA-[protein]-cysteine S-methyltransferase
MTYLCQIPSPVGQLYAASDGENIVGLWIEGQKYFEANLSEETEAKELPVFQQLKDWLNIYFSGSNPDFLPPLAPQGSAFRQSVWQILLSIPYGELTTYGAIAKQMEAQSEGKHVSAQAVGGAVGHNPISIVIPCHRVVGSTGSLTGYAGGIDKKIHLLKLEGVLMDHLFVPKKGTAL